MLKAQSTDKLTKLCLIKLLSKQVKLFILIHVDLECKLSYTSRNPLNIMPFAVTISNLQVTLFLTKPTGG